MLRHRENTLALTIAREISFSACLTVDSGTKMPNVRLPPTRYTESGEVHIAYQVVGKGPFDLVYVPGFVSNVEEAWEDPSYRRFLERLASFSRLLLFDKRGTGLSDPVSIADALGTGRRDRLGRASGTYRKVRSCPSGAAMLTSSVQAASPPAERCWT